MTGKEDRGNAHAEPGEFTGKWIRPEQCDALNYTLEHEENEHWLLAEDNNGKVGYVGSGIYDDHRSRDSPGRRGM